MKKLLFAALTLCFSVALFGAPFAFPRHAQAAYPEKPIRIIVVRNAGGSADIVARMFAPFLQKYIGTNVVVENITGGGGKVGLSQAFRANPDGYTLVLGNFPSYVLTQHIEGGVDYKMSDFEPLVGIAGNEANVLIVPGNSPYNSVQELIEQARANSSDLNIGVTSGLSNSTLALTMFLEKSGLDPQPIPFDDGNSVVTANMGGHVDMGICSAVATYQPAASGAVKVLATFGLQEDKNLPGVPTFKSIYGEEYGYDVSMGLLAPPKTPDSVLKTLREAGLKAAQDPEFLKTVGKAFGVAPTTAEQLANAIQSNYERADAARPVLEKMLGK